MVLPRKVTDFYFVRIPRTWGTSWNQGSSGGCSRSTFAHGPASINHFLVSRWSWQPPRKCGQNRFIKAYGERQPKDTGNRG